MLAVLADRIMATGDDIIIKGTVLSKDRDHGAQRQDDRERARNVAKLRLGDAIGSGPQIYLADCKLQSAFGFVQIPYLFGGRPWIPTATGLRRGFCGQQRRNSAKNARCRRAWPRPSRWCGRPRAANA